MGSLKVNASKAATVLHEYIREIPGYNSLTKLVCSIAQKIFNLPASDVKKEPDKNYQDRLSKIADQFGHNPKNLHYFFREIGNPELTKTFCDTVERELGLRKQLKEEAHAFKPQAKPQTQAPAPTRKPAKTPWVNAGKSFENIFERHPEKENIKKEFNFQVNTELEYKDLEKKLLRRFHPDRYKGPGGDIYFKQINEVKNKTRMS